MSVQDNLEVHRGVSPLTVTMVNVPHTPRVIEMYVHKHPHISRYVEKGVYIKYIGGGFSPMSYKVIL